MRHTLTSHSRRLLVALIACLALVMTSVLPAQAFHSRFTATQSSHAPLPFAPAAPGDAAGISLDLEALTPQSVTPDSTVTARVKVTNTSSAPLEGAHLEFSVLRPRVTDRSALSEWFARGTGDTSQLGTPVATSIAASVAPGASGTFTVSVPARDLGLSSDPSLWGPRRISLTVRSAATGAGGGLGQGQVQADAGRLLDAAASGTAPQLGSGQPRATMRSALVWTPQPTTPSVSLTYLAPVALADPAQVTVDQEAFAQNLEHGPLAQDLAVAARPDVSWWLDPSTLLPLAMPEGTSLQSQAVAGRARPGEGKQPSAAGGASKDTDTTEPTAPDTASSRGDSSPANSSGSASPQGGTESSTDSSAESGKGSGQESNNGSGAGFDSGTGAGTSPPSGASDAGGEDPASPSSPATAPWTAVPAWDALRDTVTTGAQSHEVLAAPFARLALENQDVPSSVSEGAARTSADLMKSAQVNPTAKVVRLDGTNVTTDAATRAADSGASALIVPAESFAKPGAVTASGYTSLSTHGSHIPVLGYDTELTALATGHGGTGDLEADQQRMRATTALIAGQDTDANRHLLIAPAPGQVTSAAYTSGMLDSLKGVSWASPAPVSELVSLAKTRGGTTNPRGSTEPYWVGPITSLSAPVQPQRASVPKASSVRTLESAVTTTRGLRAAMEDETYGNAAMLLALSGFSTPWLGTSQAQTQRHADIQRVAAYEGSRLSLTMADSYTLVSSGSGVPLSVHNDFDTAVHVKVASSTSDRIVRLPEQTIEVDVLPRSSAEVTVPIEAITSGTVQFKAAVTSPDSTTFSSGTSTIGVNPEWENWTTLVLVIGMGLLVVVGVLRARRTGSDARAPAEVGPEDLHAVDAPPSSASSQEPSASQRKP